jgi:hypothetical protein
MFRRLGGVLRWVGMRLLVALIIWAVVYTSLNFYLTWRRDRALEWFTASGIPMTPAKFDKPEVDPQDDAAPLWRAAAELEKGEVRVQLGDFIGMASLKDGQLITFDDSLGAERPLTPEELDRLRKGVADNREFFDILHRAALRPKYISPVDYNQGFNILLPHAFDALELANVLNLAAELAAYDGHIDQAIQYWTSLRALQRENIDERLLVCQLITATIESILYDSVQQTLRSGVFSEARLERVAAGLGTGPHSLAVNPPKAREQFDNELQQVAELLKPLRDYHERFRWSIQGEACMNHLFFQGLLEGGTPGTPIGFFVPPPHGVTGLARLAFLADETAELGLWRRLLESVTPDALPSQVFKLNNKSVPWYAFMSRIMMPAVSGGAECLARAEALRRVTAWSVALERQKLATGSYPDRLADLQPRFTQDLGEPTDPFTGQPLIYKPLMRDGRAAGYTLYSVGPNMKDDGGRNNKGTSGGTDDDIAFALEP